MLLSMTRRSLAVATLGAAMSLHAAEVREHDDYTAIVIEAEEFDSKDDRWILTTPSTPAQSDDPDGNHSDTAFGNAYLELLPDIRVTHEDVFGTGEQQSFWGNGNSAPRATYTVNFPEAGRYHIHVRALSTGTEDNGLHVGLNAAFPASAARVQACSAGRGWTWTSRQRDSGGAGSCGVDWSLWLDIPSAGVHEVHAAPREDGFELDRLMLIKDQSDGTRRCRPSGADGINCQNGAVPSEDGDIDLELGLTIDAETVDSETPVTVSMTARNKDNFDDANNVVLTVSPVASDAWEIESLDERCEFADDSIACELGTLSPESLEHAETIELRLVPIAEGLLELNASLSADELDTDPTSAEQSVRVDVLAAQQPTELSVTAVLPADLDEGMRALLQVGVANAGDADAENVSVEIAVPEEYRVLATPSACETVDAETLSCELPTVFAGSEWTIDVQLQAVSVGNLVIAANAAAENAPLTAVLTPTRVNEIPVEAPVEESDSEEPAPEEPAAESDNEEASTGASSGGGGGALSWWLLVGLGVLARRRV